MKISRWKEHLSCVDRLGELGLLNQQKGRVQGGLKVASLHLKENHLERQGGTFYKVM